jgi:hypothetical protein
MTSFEYEYEAPAPFHKSPSYKDDINLLSQPPRLMHQRSASDSQLKVQKLLTASAWECDFCQYQNLDPMLVRCALCGSQKEKKAKIICLDPLPPLALKRKLTDEGESPLASSKSATNNNDAEDLPSDKSSDEPQIEVAIEKTFSQDSSDYSETDFVPPLTELKDTKSSGSMSMRILDLTGMDAPEVSPHDFGHSEATLEVSNVEQQPTGLKGKGHSEITLPTSNVHGGSRRDGDFDDSIEQQSNQEVSLDELYKMGAVPTRLTDDVAKQHIKRIASKNGEQSSKEREPWSPAISPMTDGMDESSEMIEVDLETGGVPQTPDFKSPPETPLEEEKVSKKVCAFRAVFITLVVVAIILSATLTGRGNESKSEVVVAIPPITQSPSPSSVPSLTPSGGPTEAPTESVFPTQFPSDSPSTWPTSPPSS